LTASDVIDSLRFGDLIEVAWLDASESTGRFAGERHSGFDTPVRSVGYFLGLKGKRTKHVVIAKEIIDDAFYHYNVIPVGMIEGITILAKDRLDPETKRVLKKFVAVSIKKLRGKDGWAYAEGQNKKRVH
jgi:hypothetical protein